MKDLSHFMDSVWGSGATDVYTVGGFGYLMHSTGHDDWVTSQLPVKDDAEVIAGSGADNMFIANNDGQLFHLKGGAWTALTLPEGNTYATNIWALDSDNVFLIAGGDLLRGSAAGNWEVVPTPENTNGIRSVWGSSAENLYLLGDAIWHKSAISDWTAELKPNPRFLSGSSATNVYATLLDNRGSIFHSTGDGTWTEVPVSFRTDEVPTCIFTVDDTTTFIGGNKSGVYVSDANGQWKLIGVGTGGSHHAIWAPSRDEVYAVGLDGVTHGRRQ